MESHSNQRQSSVKYSFATKGRWKSAVVGGGAVLQSRSVEDSLDPDAPSSVYATVLQYVFAP